MADNVITPQESEVLAGNLDTINQLMAQIQLLQQGQQAQQAPQTQRQPVTPESLGIDRHRIIGIPVGPKLTIDPSLPTSSPGSTVLVNPQGTQDQVVVEEAANLEKAADALQ